MQDGVQRAKDGVLRLFSDAQKYQITVSSRQYFSTHSFTGLSGCSAVDSIPSPVSGAIADEATAVNIRRRAAFEERITRGSLGKGI